MNPGNSHLKWRSPATALSYTKKKPSECSQCPQCPPDPENLSLITTIPLEGGGTCASGPFHDYVTKRVAEEAPNLLAEWVPGDILFIGDSLTDIAKAYGMTPLLPRAYNSAIIGSRICDTQYCLDLLQKLFDDNNRLFLPSKTVVLVGTNNLIIDVLDTGGMTTDTKDQFDNLFNRLEQFRSQNDSCEIILRAIPPGEPDAIATSDCSSPLVNRHQYNQAVIHANHYIASACHSRHFRFVDDHNEYWHETTGRVKKPLYRDVCAEICYVDKHGNQVTGAFYDHLHLGYKGQMRALMRLSHQVLYPKLHPSHAPRPFSELAGFSSPGAPPIGSSAQDDSSMMYRYLHVDLPAGKKLVLRSLSSPTFNFAAVFLPGHPGSPYSIPGYPCQLPNPDGGFPVSESLQTDGSPAEATYHNTSPRKAIVVVCLGTDPDNQGCFQATIED